MREVESDSGTDRPRKKSRLNSVDKDERIKELEKRVTELERAVSKTSSESNRNILPVDLENQYQRSSRNDLPLPPLPRIDRLTADHIERYSRQMILSNGFGVAGQQKLLSSSVLVIGAGGIGSTALLYLASSGIGRLGIVDFDSVEVSNLHRQVIHATNRVGWNKALSACATLRDLSPTVECVAYTEELTHENVQALVNSYDCVVDCSDNPRTRYLINDACVIEGKPLVSGSSVGFEGQLTVYNSSRSDKSPCYRCLYPRPSATAGCRACSDAGVLGPVPGLIGILQSIEVLKLLTNHGDLMDRRLLMYDSMSSSFMNIRKPPNQPKCPVCGPNPTIKTMAESNESLLATAGPKRDALPPPLPKDLEVTCLEFQREWENSNSIILLDVRVKEQFDICSIPGSIHIPLEELPNRLADVEALSKSSKVVYCICRRGFRSIDAVTILQEGRPSHPGIHSVKNIEGGLDQWRETVDNSFPKY